MLVFLSSDKGGTGRSVTSCNIAYQSALRGRSACYLDFDFGSPTSGSIFNIDGIFNGTESESGLHQYLAGSSARYESVDIWTRSDRRSLRGRPGGAAPLDLYPGDAGGSEFHNKPEITDQCAELFLALHGQYDLTFVDLSAGRSYAVEIALAATAMQGVNNIAARWLVFHRWTRQHVRAAANLVYATDGLLDVAANVGHNRSEFENSVRFVRTAVIKPTLASDNARQVDFLVECNRDLTEMANNLRVGTTRTIGEVPLEPLLQWREQLISENDVVEEIAGRPTLAAFQQLAEAIVSDSAWGEP